MPDWFTQDLGHTNTGFVLGLRASIAFEIVKHAALVAGYRDGEDHAGRAAVSLLPSIAVASRANAIAEALVNEWERLAWIRPTVMTSDADWAEAGRLQGLKTQAEWGQTDAQREARLRARLDMKAAEMTPTASPQGEGK